jgi:hypothetical protein
MYTVALATHLTIARSSILLKWVTSAVQRAARGGPAKPLPPVCFPIQLALGSGVRSAQLFLAFRRSFRAKATKPSRQVHQLDSKTAVLCESHQGLLSVYKIEGLPCHNVF